MAHKYGNDGRQRKELTEINCTCLVTRLFTAVSLDIQWLQNMAMEFILPR
jgi:hypothetical protein